MENKNSFNIETEYFIIFFNLRTSQLLQFEI